MNLVVNGTPVEAPPGDCGVGESVTYA